MDGKQVQRRLAAILAADVVGYSCLMRANEVGTLATLMEHRSELIDPTIAEKRGRIVTVAGDGLLAEFASVVDAVDCATKIQQEMYTRNAEVPQDRRVDLRIGIHFGDVICEGDDISVTVDRALAINPNLAEAHAARGYALMVADRRSEAPAAFERALALDPNCHEAHYHFADFCVTAGDFAQAAEHYIRALEIKPDDYISPILLLGIFRSLGRPQEAEGYAHLGLKRAEEALRLHPEDSKSAQLGASALATLGEHDQAKEWLARALAIDPNDNGTRYNAACVYALLGEPDRAIDLLEVYLRQVGPDPKLWFKNDSDLESIRSHPRYAKLLELAG